MMYMLDTNIIIYLIKKKSQSIAECVVGSSPNDHLVISFITYDELFKGTGGSRNREKLLFSIARLTRKIGVVYPDESICTYYDKRADALKRQGTLTGNNALWTACHALACGAVLVTNSTREFERIGELAMKN